MRRISLAAASLLWSLAAPVAFPATPTIDKRVASIVSKLRRPTIEELWAAHRQLTKLGPDAVPAIKSRLAKLRPGAQLALAKALCSLGVPKDAVEPLVALIRAKPNLQYSVLAASILGQTPARDVPATERHLERLADDRSLAPEVARVVARSLHFAATTERNLKRANGALRRLLVAAKDPLARRECALALAEIDDFAPPVKDMLKEIEEQPTPAGRLARALLQKRNFRDLIVKAENREGWLSNQLLDEVRKTIQRYHVEKPLPDHKLVNAAARGMVSAVHGGGHPDRFSAFFDEDDWKKFREHIAGHYGGIGAVVQMMKHFDTGKDPVFTVVRPNYKGPAYRAGVRSYDRILEVDGEPTAGKKLKDIVEGLRGKPGTPVEITVTRPGSKDKHKLKIVRGDIDLPTVRARLLPGKIGYVRLASFGESTARDLDKALRRLEREGMVALILDLRNNPGGQLATAVEVADKFLKDNKLIVYTHGRNQEIAAREEFRTKDPTTHPDYPMIVLVNEHSASAAEIVAGALQDHHRAILIGVKTYGKGSVQKLFPLKATAGQSGIKLTIAKYYLPSGRSIHGKGVEPDIKVKFKATYSFKEFEHLRETGAFHRYAAPRFGQHKALFGEFAAFDGLDASRYPDFDDWYRGLAEEIGRDKARRLLRAWLRILVTDGRGAGFACDVQEDNQLQRAILELAKRLEELDPEKVPEYRSFALAASKPVEAKKADTTPDEPRD